MIPFKEIIKRITGFSTPFFGVSWEPSEIERDKARRLLTFLEDQRLLLGNYEFLLKDIEYLIDALYRLRNKLTEELEALDQSSPLTKLISSMRSACRKCLDSIQMYNGSGGTYSFREHRVYFAAIGELRAILGLQIAQICARYELDISEELGSILPSIEDEETKNTSKSV